jgi:hypothetical protein
MENRTRSLSGDLSGYRILISNKAEGQKVNKCIESKGYERIYELPDDAKHISIHTKVTSRFCREDCDKCPGYCDVKNFKVITYNELKSHRE